ncbi:MAG: hypothetical protein AAF591_11445 [Verrucomicrobiota bacterium]
MKCEFSTDLSPNECLDRIRDQTDVLSRWKGLLGFQYNKGNQPIVSKIDGHGFRLHKRLWFRNGCQTFLYGILDNQGQGTSIRCELGMSRTTKGIIFFVVTFAILAGIANMLFGNEIQDQAGTGILSMCAWSLSPTIVLAIAATFTLFGRFLARHEASFLKQSLTSILDARAV